jgi:hypothetical protein
MREEIKNLEKFVKIVQESTLLKDEIRQRVIKEEEKEEDEIRQRIKRE